MGGGKAPNIAQPETCATKSYADAARASTGPGDSSGQVAQELDLVSEIAANFTCTFCLEVWDDPVTAVCGHTFCRRCLAEWLCASQTCPLDRRRLSREAPATAIHLKDLVRRLFPGRTATAAARAARANAVADIRDALLGSGGSVGEHLDLQARFPRAYPLLLKAACDRGIVLPQRARIRILAAAWALKSFELSDFVLKQPGKGLLVPNISGGSDHFGFVDFAKAARLLDAPRIVRAKRSKLETIEEKLRVRAAAARKSQLSEATGSDGLGDERKSCAQRGTHANRNRFSTDAKLRRAAGALNAEITDLERESVPRGSLSGALIKGLRKLVSMIPAEKLKHFALQGKFDDWRALAGVLHLSPDGLTQPGFLEAVFGSGSAGSARGAEAGEPALDITTPAETCEVEISAARLAQLAELNRENAAELILELRPAYTHVRTALAGVGGLSPAGRAAMSRVASIDTCLWWLQELECEAAYKTITERLAAGEIPSISVGQMLQVLLRLHQGHCRFAIPRAQLVKQLIPVADQLIDSLRLPLEAPVAVLGDASASMQVAIDSAVIISALLSRLSAAELLFFSHKARPSACQPRTVSDVFTVAGEVRAGGSTSPAAALWPFYEQKRELAVVVVVTDEEENTPWRGHDFAALWGKYRAEVSPRARLVFVSFLHGDGDGQMVRALKRAGVAAPRCFRFDPGRPDLTKLDSLLAAMSVETAQFNTELEAAVSVDLGIMVG